MNPDSDNHLGSSTFLTDAAGEPYQFVMYLPFGETFTEQRAAGFGTPYLFNAKELDEETGLYYYGARYYDARISTWWGVDPLAGKYPEYSPYTYTLNNPVRYVDPDGMRVEDFIDIDKTCGHITITPAPGDDIVRMVDNDKVIDTYTYGPNGSFRNENMLGYGPPGSNGQTVTTSSTSNADKFYRFAAKSNVEFGKLDVTKNGVNTSIIATTHDPEKVSSLPGLVNIFSKGGYTGLKQSHSHPDGQIVPSGHYDYVNPKNPWSMTPVPIGSKFDKGDAPNARYVRSLPGFENTKFEVYNPINGGVTVYDGIHQAKFIK